MNYLGQQLVSALAGDDIEYVPDLLEQGANPNYVYEGFTPLGLAVTNGNLYVVSLLRSKGAKKELVIPNLAGRVGGPKNAIELSAKMVEMNPGDENYLGIAFLLADTGTPNRARFEKQLARLAKDPAYEFYSENVEKIARGIMERRDVTDSIVPAVEERAKAKVRGLKKTVMSELKAVPGGPEYEAAKARFERPGGRRQRSTRRRVQKKRRTRHK